MHRFAKQLLAVSLAAAMALPAMACQKDNSSTQSSGSGSGINAENSAINTDEQGMVKIDLTFQDNDKEDESSVTPSVTTVVGDDGKVYVNQTDINGTTVTQAGGAPATELFTGTTLATSYPKKDYQPNVRSYQALWLDMSKKKDFVFDGEFLVFNVKINETAEDGVYPIELYHTDIANYDAQSLSVTTNVGYICVNCDEPKVEKKTGDNLILSASNVSGKPGDTVQLVLDVQNNPGFVGFNIMFHYDKNVITVESSAAGKDFSSRTGLMAHEVTT